MRRPGRVSHGGLLALVLLAIAISGCGDHRVRTRYLAERELWRAASSRRELPAVRSRYPGLLALASRYESIATRYQQPEVSDSLAASIHALAGRAWLGAAECYLAAMDTFTAGEILHRHRTEFESTPAVAGEFAWRQGTLAEADRRYAEAMAHYEFAIQAIAPDPGAASAADSVLRLPVRLVRLALLAADSTSHLRLASVARETYQHHLESDSLDVRRQATWYLAALEEEEGHYDAAVAALGGLEIDVARDHPIDFEPGEVRLRAFECRVKAWFAGSAPFDTLRPALEDLIHDYPDRNIVGRALWGLACAARDRGLSEDARRTFAGIRLRYARARIAPRAMLAQARLLDHLGRWHDAYMVYRLLETEYPLSQAGLEVPLELVRHHRRNGNTREAHLALIQARQTYEEIMARYPPGAHSVDLRERWIDVHEELGEYETVVQSTLELSRRFRGGPRELALLLRAQRVAAEHLEGSDSSAAILGRILERFPQTRAAKWAQLQLDRPVDQTP